MKIQFFIFQTYPGPQSSTLLPSKSYLSGFNRTFMQRELYFDISTEKNGGSLYRITGENGKSTFLYSHSTYDDVKDEVKIFETMYADFSAFWMNLLKDPKWFYWHPLYIHPEQRTFVQDQLKKANWASHPNKKWQESHQRQWKKVLNDPGNYYRGPTPTL